MNDRRLVAAVSLICGSLAAAAPGSSDTLSAAASAAAGNQDWDRAYSLGKQALLQGGFATPAQTATAHAFVGRASAALGQTQAAVESFERALEINPAFELPLDASPRIAHPFQAAQRMLQHQHLSAKIGAVRGRDGQARLTVSLMGDTLALAAQGRLYISDAGQVTPRLFSLGAAVAARWSCSALPCPHWIELVDGDGNVVWTAGNAATPLQAEDERPPMIVNNAATHRAWYQGPLPFLVGSVGLAAGAAVTFYAFERDQSQLVDWTQPANRSAHPLSQLNALDSQRRAERTAAILCLTGAGLASVGVVWRW